MNDLQINYFLAVADNLSFTKTAEELYITQPAISRQISSLEKELGVTLFDRTNKSTKLTEAGKLYYKFFIEYKNKFVNIKEEAKNINQNCQGTVRLGCLEGWDLSGFFPQVLNVFSNNYPNINLSLSCYGIKNLVRALIKDEIDVALTIDVTLPVTTDLQTIVLKEIPKIIIYSKKGYTQNVLSPEDFKNDTFLVVSEDEASYAKDLLITYCKPYGFIPKIKYVKNIDSMLAGVQNGMGVAILDDWTRTKNQSDFGYVLMNSTNLVSLAWKTDSNNQGVSILANELAFILKINDEL